MSKTQTSISQYTKRKKAKRVTSTAYVSPQRLENVYNEYDVKAEIYRYVHVLGQILTQVNETGKSKSNTTSKDRSLTSTLLTRIEW